MIGLSGPAREPGFQQVPTPVDFYKVKNYVAADLTEADLYEPCVLACWPFAQLRHYFE